MSHKILSLLILFFVVFGLNGTVESGSHARAYLERLCRSTMYPDQCVRTLLPYVTKTSTTSPQRLARISLTSCLVKARFTKTYINMVARKFNNTKNAGYDQSMVDCLSQINDGVSQITQSVKELDRMEHDGEAHFVWHQSNVETWVSTALTDATACLDGISGRTIRGKEKALIKARVLNVKQLASNALALFNRFTARHHAPHSIKKP